MNVVSVMFKLFAGHPCLTADTDTRRFAAAGVGGLPLVTLPALQQRPKSDVDKCRLQTFAGQKPPVKGTPKDFGSTWGISMFLRLLYRIYKG